MCSTISRDCWLKLCWLLEIQLVMSKRSLETAFWSEVDDRMRGVPCLGEFAAIVIGLAELVFASSTPNLMEDWRQSLRPASRLWLQDYAESWVLADHPLSSSCFLHAAKLALLVHQAYVPDPKIRREVVRQRLFPWKTRARIAFPR